MSRNRDFSSLYLDSDYYSRSAFTKPLVLISSPVPKWTTHDACVWTAEDALKTAIRLSNEYGDCKKLFLTYLGVRNAGMTNIMAEVFSLARESYSETESRCEDILNLMQKYIRKEGLNNFHREMIRKAKIFAVLYARPAGAPVIKRCSLVDLDWYIPDVITLESSFRNKVNLLCFSVRSVQSLAVVFEKLGCDAKLLSKVVKESVTTSGVLTRYWEMERDMTRRLKYIARFVDL